MTYEEYKKVVDDHDKYMQLYKKWLIETATQEYKGNIKAFMHELNILGGC